MAITYDREPGTKFPFGVNIVTAIATDKAFNKASCEFIIIVEEETD